MSTVRLALTAAVLMTAGATAASAAERATVSPARSGCSIVTDPSGDTAADVGAPATLPQSDAGLDLSGVDVASSARWIGARVRLVQLDRTPPASGGESFTVSMSVSGGTLTLGVGRYADATGSTGAGEFGYAGFQRGTLGPRNVPARAVQLLIDPYSHTASVFVARAALSDIGAALSGSVSNVTATSGRQYGNAYTVDYDNAAGPASYRLGAPSCLRLPS